MNEAERRIWLDTLSIWQLAALAFQRKLENWNKTPRGKLIDCLCVFEDIDQPVRA